MTEKQGLCGTLSEASHPRGLKWLSMWENAKSRPTEQAPKGGIGGKTEKRPFFIPHIAAKIGVNVGMVLKSRKYNYGMYADTAVLADWFYSKTEKLMPNRAHALTGPARRWKNICQMRLACSQVLLNGRIHNKRVPQRKAALVKTAESRARQSVGELFCLQNGGYAGKVEGETRKTRPAKMACPDARPERCERVRVT